MIDFSLFKKDEESASRKFLVKNDFQQETHIPNIPESIPSTVIPLSFLLIFFIEHYFEVCPRATLFFSLKYLNSSLILFSIQIKTASYAQSFF